VDAGEIEQLGAVFVQVEIQANGDDPAELDQNE